MPFILNYAIENCDIYCLSGLPVNSYSLWSQRKVGSSRCCTLPFWVSSLHTSSGIPTILPTSSFISLPTFLHIATRMPFQNASLINTKNMIMKEIIDKQDFLKIKNCCSAKDTIKNMRRQDTDQEKIVCKTHFIKACYPKCTTTTKKKTLKAQQ